MIKYKLFDINGIEIKLNEIIKSNDGSNFIFNGFSMGRIGPKILVREENSFQREMFFQVFDRNYYIEEIQ